jgi:CelD/BcsL family acetyltransferase involved in cellulose biosynthesis
LIVTEPDTAEIPGPGRAVPLPDAAVPEAPPCGVRLIRPLEDSRWNAFVQAHPESSVFHSAEWLSALHKTYGFEPLALSTFSSQGTLQSALLFCIIASPLTGRRLVSLPFSDHCAPLVTGSQDLGQLMTAMREEMAARRFRYAEIRPTHDLTGRRGNRTSYTYRWHWLDLTGSTEEIAHRFHKDCVMRKIRRAEREKLSYRRGAAYELIPEFWELFVATRKRLQSPPQPISWFRNLMSSFGGAAALHVAAKDGVPVAAILTIRHKDTLVYKYGCSDVRFQNLGGTQFLFWHAIQEAKEQGLHTFDLGRSNYSDQGLIRFKDRWGAESADLIYYRFTAKANSRAGYGEDHESVPSQVCRRLLSYLPDRLFSTAGALLYRHIA